MAELPNDRASQVVGEIPDLPECNDQEMLQHCCTLVCMMGMWVLAKARKNKIDERGMADDLEGMLALVSNTLTIRAQREQEEGGQT